VDGVERGDLRGVALDEDDVCACFCEGECWDDVSRLGVVSFGLRLLLTHGRADASSASCDQSCLASEGEEVHDGGGGGGGHVCVFV